MSQKRKTMFKGKQIILLGLVAMVITAGYYRWNVESQKYQSVPVTGEAVPQTAEQGEGGNDGGQGGEISRLKQERDQARSEAIEQWKETSQSEDASAETKAAAEKKVKDANDYAEKEKSIETLVKAKGYTDCFAHVSENGVTVQVSGGEVNGNKVAQIKDIIVGETNASVRNIRISAD